MEELKNMIALCFSFAFLLVGCMCIFIHRQEKEEDKVFCGDFIGYEDYAEIELGDIHFFEKGFIVDECIADMNCFAPIY